MDSYLRTCSPETLKVPLTLSTAANCITSLHETTNPQFQTAGYAVFPQVLQAHDVTGLLDNLARATQGSDHYSIFSERNLLAKHTFIQHLAASEPVLGLARDLIGSSARAVKATLFDKNAQANWVVPPHQDVTIAVQSGIDTPGYGPWTEKAGIANVQPPADILQQMVAFRIHLDDCDETNGALRVWPGSHLHGRLRDSGISDWVQTHNEVSCPVEKGGLMAMRPLLIHASSKAIVPTHRRVIHIEYAACDLPNGLQWLNEIG
jgi:ectoine hydroxylase-related dioxygenase (phytanoyl-CoA dioxygenase family)